MDARTSGETKARGAKNGTTAQRKLIAYATHESVDGSRLANLS